MWMSCSLVDIVYQLFQSEIYQQLTFIKSKTYLLESDKKMINQNIVDLITIEYPKIVGTPYISF